MQLKSSYFAIPIVFLVPFILIVFKPILFPFADDWLIVGWASGDGSLKISDLLQTVNGHQVVTSKLLLYSLGNINSFNIQLASLASYILGSFGITLLVYSQLQQLGKKNSFLVTLTCLIIGSNYKQMQNYFMPICNGWMLAIFFIGIYYFLKQLQTTRFRSLLISGCIILAPLSIGLGVILPIIQSIENLYIFLGKKKKKISFAMVSTSFASAISFAIIVLYKRYGVQDVSGSTQGLELSDLIKPLLHPIDALKFVLTLIGSVFVPSSRFEPGLPIIAGTVFSMLVIYYVTRNYKHLDLSDYLLNRSCLLGGLIYASFLYLFRYTDANNGLIGIAAPRYVTGTIILILSGIVLIVKLSSSTTQIKSIFIVISICILISGTKTGLEWHSVRFSQSQILMRCIEDKEFSLNTYCYKLARESSMTPSLTFFDSELSSFIKGVSSAK